MDYTYERVTNARTVLGQAYEMASKVKHSYDKYTILKSGYAQACILVPDKLKTPDRKLLHIVAADKYADQLNSLRVRNVNAVNFNKQLDEKYHALQNDLIDFQKYALSHQIQFIDNLYVLDAKGNSNQLTTQEFADYIEPYWNYLQDLYRKIRKSNFDI